MYINNPESQYTTVLVCCPWLSSGTECGSPRSSKLGFRKEGQKAAQTSAEPTQVRGHWIGLLASQHSLSLVASSISFFDNMQICDSTLSTINIPCTTDRRQRRRQLLRLRSRPRHLSPHSKVHTNTVSVWYDYFCWHGGYKGLGCWRIFLRRNEHHSDPKTTSTHTRE